MSMSIRAAIAVGLVAALGWAGCASHEPRAAFRRGVLIDDRGISVPLPPPSLVDAPLVEVEVHGEVPGEDELVLGTRIHLEDLDGTARVSAEVDPAGESFVLEQIPIDLTANCLELWLEAPDGRESGRSHVHATIAAEHDVVTVLGCDD
jgi:hypothetical protein